MNVYVSQVSLHAKTTALSRITRNQAVAYTNALHAIILGRIILRRIILDRIIIVVYSVDSK